MCAWELEPSIWDFERTPRRMGGGDVRLDRDALHHEPTVLRH